MKDWTIKVNKKSVAIRWTGKVIARTPNDMPIDEAKANAYFITSACNYYSDANARESAES